MDPSHLTQRQESLSLQLDGPTDTPTSKTMQTPVSTKVNEKVGGVGNAAPRIDTEPIYTALKTALGESFTAYRDIIAGFVLGAYTYSI